MQIKLLHDLVEELAGVNTGRIVSILFGKKDVNEFLIAKKMELTINQVRNILYRLSADGLVSFIRKKDKRKGWYIYYWTLKTEKCLVRLEQSLIRKIENLKGILNNREVKRYYICKPCEIEVGEEKALEHGFTCEECSEVYELVDNSGAIRDTKTKITRTEKELETIHGQLEAVREKEQKKRSRANMKEAKENEAKKSLLKVARATARKKIADKTKKIVKKEVLVKKKTPVGKKIIKKKVIPKKVIKKKVIKKSSAKKEVIKKKVSLASKLKNKFLKKK
ncbi:hypothetical protein KAI32_03935 [Candidatus Pacearchaeota archaeon]|nr:hypothetical protein [Candidatus Pacearchaeota archaeon]